MSPTDAEKVKLTTDTEGKAYLNTEKGMFPLNLEFKIQPIEKPPPTQPSRRRTRRAGRGYDRKVDLGT